MTTEKVMGFEEFLKHVRDGAMDDLNDVDNGKLRALYDRMQGVECPKVEWLNNMAFVLKDQIGCVKSTDGGAGWGFAAIIGSRILASNCGQAEAKAAVETAWKSFWTKLHKQGE